MMLKLLLLFTLLSIVCIPILGNTGCIVAGLGAVVMCGKSRD